MDVLYSIVSGNGLVGSYCLGLKQLFSKVKTDGLALTGWTTAMMVRVLATFLFKVLLFQRVFLIVHVFAKTAYGGTED